MADKDDIDLREVAENFGQKDRVAIESLTLIYGEDVNDLINGLHSLTARLAIIAGVEPEDYAAGVKHHWDHLAGIVNDAAQDAETTT